MFSKKLDLTDHPSGRIDRQLERLNVNIERYLDHLGIQPLPSAAQLSAAETQTYIGEPLTDIEIAIKEYAELTGQEWKHHED